MQGRSSSGIEGIRDSLHDQQFGYGTVHQEFGIRHCLPGGLALGEEETEFVTGSGGLGGWGGGLEVGASLRVNSAAKQPTRRLTHDHCQALGGQLAWNGTGGMNRCQH